jgi:hypothetical protein
MPVAPVAAPVDPEADVDDPARIHVELVDIDPEMAERLLITNAGNRVIRARAVKQLAETMRSGLWRLTGEGIKFDRKGNLIDGQHRLMAVIQAGVPVKFHVFHGLARDIYRHLDTGVARSYTDVLKIDQERHAGALAAAATWVRYYLKSFTGPRKLSHEMGDRVLDDHPRLREFADYRTKSGLLQPGMAVAFRYLCALKDEDLAARFFQELADGTARSDTPVYTLRERLIREKASGRKRTLTPDAVASCVIKAWNATVTGEPLTTLKWTRGEKIPSLIDVA